MNHYVKEFINKVTSVNFKPRIKWRLYCSRNCLYIKYNKSV